MSDNLRTFIIFHRRWQEEAQMHNILEVLLLLNQRIYVQVSNLPHITTHSSRQILNVYAHLLSKYNTRSSDKVNAIVHVHPYNLNRMMRLLARDTTCQHKSILYLSHSKVESTSCCWLRRGVSDSSGVLVVEGSKLDQYKDVIKDFQYGCDLPLSLSLRQFFH